MGMEVHTLFTAALGLKAPWEVAEVTLDTGSNRIDFQVACTGKRLACRVCDAQDQRIHDRLEIT